jgi:hypothetical protein
MTGLPFGPRQRQDFPGAGQQVGVDRPELRPQALLEGRPYRKTAARPQYRSG